MDMRVLSRAPLAGTRAFIDRVRPVAVAGFLAQATTGVMLLSPEATHIGQNPAFQLKVLAILLGLANVLVLETAVRRTGAIGGTAKASAAASLALWLSTAAAGRLIAYF
jgi:hypothetical protein